MPIETFEFPGHGGHALAARLERPAGPVRAAALFAHCFTCGKDSTVARRLSRRLAAEGYAVLGFDFTGLGASEGDFAATSFASNAADLVAAAQAMVARDMAPGLLIGHSLGGAAAIRAASDIASVKAVAVIGAPFDPGHVTRHFEAALDRIARDGAAEVDLGGRPVRIGRAFVEDVARGDLGPDLRALKAALLVLHAPRDEIVGIDNATRIFTAALHPKSFVSLDDADHLLSRAEDAEHAAEVIGAWAARHVGLRRPAPPPAVPEGVTRVSEADPDGFLQDVVAGLHHILADEPAAYGGTNQGLTPYGLLAAGLGACTTMTIRMYARRKSWPLAHVAVDVTHAKVHAQDCEDCGPGANPEARTGARIDRFRRVIRLEGDLSADQRARLLEIADRCPVNRTLEARAEIETALAED
jgi:putative redox protein